MRSGALRPGTTRTASPGAAPEPPDAVLEAVRTVVEGRGHRVPVRYASLDGAVTDALAAVARGARFLVTGSRGHAGFAALPLGSAGRTLAATAPCPLVVVPHEARAAVPEGGAGTGRVLLGLQTEETPDEVVDFAFEAARHRDGPLEVVTAFRLPPRPGALLAAPSPALQVPPPLADDGLVVVGRHRRHRLGVPLIGSVAHAVLQHASCPVAVVPARRGP